jgi:hypothetical protein
MNDERLIVFRLCGPSIDGRWRRYPATPTMVVKGDDLNEDVRLVPTGALEWDGDRCAEVWVPESRLAEYRAEWDIDVSSR